MSEEQPSDEELAHRVLVGDLDSIRHLLATDAGGAGEAGGTAAKPIPLLRDIVESALEARGYSIDELLPQLSELDGGAIPVLTDCADGQRLESQGPDLRAHLDAAAATLVEDTLDELLPVLEKRLRSELEDVCRRHIDALLGD